MLIYRANNSFRDRHEILGNLIFEKYQTIHTDIYLGNSWGELWITLATPSGTLKKLWNEVKIYKFNLLTMIAQNLTYRCMTGNSLSLSVKSFLATRLNLCVSAINFIFQFVFAHPFLANSQKENCVFFPRTVCFCPAKIYCCFTAANFVSYQSRCVRNTYWIW